MSVSANGPPPAQPVGLAARPGGEGNRRSWRIRHVVVGDTAFRLLCQAAAVTVVALAVLLVAVLVQQAMLAIRTTGVDFFTTTTWDPEPGHRKFGAVAFVYGTIVTSVIAMLVAVPVGVGTAAFLSEVAPRWLRRSGSYFVEMLAAIPSVVYGFWGLYVFAPAFQGLVSTLGGPDQAGIGLLPAGLILGLMIVPYVSAVSFDVIQAVPRSQREGALALGASRWQVIWTAVLPFARGGIIGGCFLALGRALGETMAVTMLIGNRPDVSLSLFGKGNSIPSVIANEFTEATYDLYLSALVELGLVLLLVSVGFSAVGRLLILRMGRIGSKPSVLARTVWSLRLWGKGEGRGGHGREGDSGEGFPSVLPSTRRAIWVNRLMVGGEARTVNRGIVALALLGGLFAAVAFLVEDPSLRPALLGGIAAAAAVTVVATLGVLGLSQMLTTVPLFLILGYLLYRGATSLNWEFFTQLPAPVGQTGGGMANAFYGSGLMIALATAFSVPLGLLTAVYLAEFRAGWFGAAVRFVAEMLGSVPSIVIGIFGYYAVVKPVTNHFSGLAGGFVLGVMMLPIIIRTSEGALKTVPMSLRHASYALGASQWQTIVRVSLPAALPGIITAVFLGIARVAGETAPLLLTASSNAYWPRSLNDYTPSLPVFIFNYAVSPYEDWHRQAWAAAFVLVSAIMVLNVGVRLLAGRRVMVAGQAD
ncbi:MAG: phosphate ABC transporter permease subunit PstC [Gemmataceae bacterium]|nr:phosphate ABC transporter permease subunit PstC [Gemmataceae bacterium]